MAKRTPIKVTYKLCIYLLLVVLFIAVMLLSNNIISAWLGDIRQTAFSDYVTTATVKCNVERIEPYGDMAETVDLAGWAFADSTAPENNKRICIVLNSETDCYEADTVLERRFDVVSAFNQVHHIPSVYNGFITEFSTIGMKSGAYQVYVFCSENETAQGIYATPYTLIKNGKNVTIEANYQ